jgi:hypothetical protein
MKTSEFLTEYTYVKRQVRNTTRKIMLIRMVTQNIQDLIPSDDAPYNWELTPCSYGIKIKAGSGLTVQDADKLAGRLAKALHYEPRKEIYESIITWDFWTYPVAFDKHDWIESVNIEISAGNTEKCDFIIKRKMQKISEPTGYCKALKEKMYLNE